MQMSEIIMWIISVFYFLGTVVFVVSERCPLNEQIHPCTCVNVSSTEDIFVSCSGEHMNMTLNDLEASLKNLKGKKNVKLELKLIKLGAMPSNFFEGIGIVVLSIRYCELNSLTDNKDQPVLIGLENSLEELTIESSLKDDSLTTLKLEHLHKLRNLELVRNVIPELTNELFDNAPTSLEVIYLYNNSIAKLGNRAFAKVTKLKEITLSFNKLEDVRRSMFPQPASSLVTLNLNINKLSSLPYDMFSNMPNLKNVWLVWNNISRLEKDTWEPIWEQLQTIYLKGNPLVCDSHLHWILNHNRQPSEVKGKCIANEYYVKIKLMQFIEGLKHYKSAVTEPIELTEHYKTITPSEKFEITEIIETSELTNQAKTSELAIQTEATELIKQTKTTEMMKKTETTEQTNQTLTTKLNEQTKIAEQTETTEQTKRTDHTRPESRKQDFLSSDSDYKYFSQCSQCFLFTFIILLNLVY